MQRPQSEHELDFDLHIFQAYNQQRRKELLLNRKQQVLHERNEQRKDSIDRQGKMYGILNKNKSKGISPESSKNTLQKF